MKFRLATLDDVAALSEVRLSVRENQLSDPARIPRAMYVAHLTSDGRGWLCEIDGQVVGFAIARRVDGWIWALFVLPEFEGRGVGQRLLALAFEWLFAQGFEVVQLCTGVGTRADRFYARAGWTRGEIKEDGEVCYALRRPSTS